MTRLRGGSRTRDERGVQLVEMALVFPVLLFMTAGIVDFGLMLNSYQVLTNAAREGARYAAIQGVVDDEAVRARVETYVTAAGLTGGVASTVATAVNIGSGGVTPFPAAQVEVSYEHAVLMLRPVAPLLASVFPETVTLRATATMRLEGVGTP